VLDRHRDFLPPTVAHHAATGTFPAVVHTATDALALSLHDRF